MTRLLSLSVLLLHLGTTAAAQEITLADLQGVTMNATIKDTGTFRRVGVTYDAYSIRRFTIKVGAQGAITTASVREVYWEGQVKRLKRNFVGFIGQPSANQSKDVQALWLLEGDTLTALNVFDVGGRSLKFKIAKTPAGLSCVVDEQFMQEVGAGRTKITGAAGGKVEILKLKLTGTQCTIKKE